MEDQSLNEQDVQVIRQAESEYRRRSADDFMLFCKGLRIPSGHGPQTFKNCIADFQLEFFKQLAPALHAVRDGRMPPSRRFWLERTKKASKDADLAIALLWLVAFPRRPLYMQVGAADRDQAGIIRRRIQDLLFYNSWIKEFVTLYQYEAKSNDGLVQLDILSADIAGSHGETPDVLVINELSHMVKWEFAENLMDNADGVPQGLVVIATNAGFHGTKAEVWRNSAIRSKEWKVHILDRPAPWHTEENLADAKSRNPPSRYKRLWWGKWVSGKGDAVDEENIERMFKKYLKPAKEREEGFRYIAGLDLGVSQDHSGLVVLGIHAGRQKIRVSWMEAWEPNERTGEVDLMAVEQACLKAHSKFRIIWFGYDPSQAKLMAQRLSKKGLHMRDVHFTTTNISHMAESFIQVVEQQKLESYEDPDGRLRRDIGKFTIVEKPYGYKLEAVSDEYGHADVGTALVIALPKALSLLSGWGLAEDDVLAWTSDDEMTEEEIEDMPEEFKELFDAHGDTGEFFEEGEELDVF